MRVVMVGAGMAGLTCARALQQQGIDVEVVEAARRAGGRARTVSDRFAGGQYVESGAEWVDTDHHRMRALLDRFGMQLQGEGQEWTTIRRMLFRDGRLFGADQIRELDPRVDADLARYEDCFEQIAAGIADPSRPDLHPDAAVHDHRTMADVALDADLGDLAALFAQRNSQGEFASEPNEVSSLFVAQQRANMSAQGVEGVVRAHRVEGGLRTLVGHLVDELGADLVNMGECVTAIRWRDGGVEVTTEQRTVVADAVVLACSVVALRRIVFDPVLPGPLAAAIAELGYGTVTKTAVQFPQRTWPDGYATTTLAVQRVYEPTVDQPGEAGVLMSYAGGDGGRHLAERPEEERLQMVAGDLGTMYANTTGPVGGFSRAWSNEPRYGGSYAAYGRGQVTAHWQVLRAPCGPLHLAGEHVATWTGYLEGAVESGEQVAQRIAAS